MATPSVIQRKVIYSGVTALARETGFSQPYVSKLLARGYSANDIRDKMEMAGFKREMRAARKETHERITAEGRQ